MSHTTIWLFAIGICAKIAAVWLHRERKRLRDKERLLDANLRYVDRRAEQLDRKLFGGLS